MHTDPIKARRVPRRTFLKTLAFAAAPMILPTGAFGRDGQPGANGKIATGHIGVGPRGRFLLEQLRETRAIQVTVEARFVKVSRNFMEDVGLNLDFFFNTTDPNHFSAIAVTQNSAAFTQNPQTKVPGSLGASANPPLTPRPREPCGAPRLTSEPPRRCAQKIA